MRKQKVLDTVEDLVGKFLYYDRKNDDDLPQGEIEKAIGCGEITTTEIVDKFKAVLERYV